MILGLVREDRQRALEETAYSAQFRAKGAPALPRDSIPLD